MTPGAADGPEFLKTVARDYFEREAEVFRGTPLDEIVAAMEAAGIERVILTCDVRSQARRRDDASTSGPVPRLVTSGAHRPNRGQTILT